MVRTSSLPSAPGHQRALDLGVAAEVASSSTSSSGRCTCQRLAQAQGVRPSLSVSDSAPAATRARSIVWRESRSPCRRSCPLDHERRVSATAVVDGIRADLSEDAGHERSRGRAERRNATRSTPDWRPRPGRRGGKLSVEIVEWAAVAHGLKHVHHYLPQRRVLARQLGRRRLRRRRRGGRRGSCGGGPC